MNACRVTPIRFASRSIARSKSTGKSTFTNLADADRPVGACEFGYFFGPTLFTLLAPDDAVFTPEPGSRCTAVLQPAR